MQDRWSDADAQAAITRWGDASEALALRTYSSRLIGAEPALVLHGGGNTSVKDRATTAVGDDLEVLRVKGSGWDLASIEPPGFPAVDLAWVRRLRALEVLSDEDMVNALRTHLLDASAPNPSIETLLHAFLPHRFVDHSHADAILGLTNRAGGAEMVREALGDAVVIVPYVMAGFELSRVAAELHDAHPGCEGMVLLHHGLFTFGETARESYGRHIDLVSRAEAFLGRGTSRSTYVPPLHSDSAARSRERAGRIAPVLRGALALDGPVRWIVKWWGDSEMLDLSGAPQLARWAESGPLTPDHVIRTKPRPLVLDGVDPDTSPELLREALLDAVRGYGERYDAYVERCAAQAGGIEAYTRLDSRPRVIWAPGVGLFTAGATARACGIAADIARHTLRLKQQAEALGPFEGLAEEQLFEMEYWSLEQAKLARGTAPPLARKVALVTGGAGAIGVGVARQLLAAGAHVVLTDIDQDALDRAVAELGASEQLATALLDVTHTDSVREGFAEAARAFGGVDIVVVNAGVAAAGALHTLDDHDFDHAVEVNLGGAFRTLREASLLLRLQGTGGDIVVISTKNVAAPGAEFGAYSASKAGAHQLARVAALELAEVGVRVNLVAPDAVFAEGSVRSGLWDTVGAERARARGMDPADLPAYYRGRNLLHAQVLATHVGNAVVFFASEQTPTTGAVLPVDGGLPGAFPR